MQLAGENYLVPVDARISSPDRSRQSNSVRLVDVMATLEAIPSRLRLVRARRLPQQSVPDRQRRRSGPCDRRCAERVVRRLFDGAGRASAGRGRRPHPYTQAFLQLAREPNVPIEQLFKRVGNRRGEPDHRRSADTLGELVPDQRLGRLRPRPHRGHTRPPAHGPVVQMASNLPTRSVRKACDYVAERGFSALLSGVHPDVSPPIPSATASAGCWRACWRRRRWHKAVALGTRRSPTRRSTRPHQNSPYALSALKLKSQPKLIPLMQATKFLAPQNIAPTLEGRQSRPAQIHAADPAGQWRRRR